MRERNKYFLLICLLAFTYTLCNRKNVMRNFLPRMNQTLSSSDTFLADGEVEAFCFANINGVVYDLNPLYDATSDYLFKSKGENYYFNFCKFGSTKCKKDNTYIVAAKGGSVVNNTTTECSLLSGTNYDSLPKWKITNNLGEPSKIAISFPEGDQCVSGNSSYYYTTTFEITCDKNTAKLSVDNLDSVSINQCHNKIQMRSQFACPNVNKYSLHNTIVKNSATFGLMLMAVGIYYCFFAYKYIKVTRILTGVTTVSFISLFLFANNFEMKFTSANFWSVFIISILLGLFLGWIISKVPWVVSAVLGAFLGFIFTELLYQMIVSSLSWNPRAVYYIIFSISIVFFAALGGFFQKHIFIISCAFTGAYSIIRSLGTLEHNYPDEKQLYDLIERNEWWQVSNMIDYRFYLYLVFAFILGLIGTCHQYKSYFKDIREDDYEFNKVD